MTLIAVAHGLVIADSARATNQGMEFRTGKVVSYSKPVKMWSKRLKCKDWFYGFAGTGEEEVIQQAGEMAIGGCLDLWWDRYKHVDEMRMINDSTSFSIALFGLNGVVLLEVLSGEIQMVYLSYLEYGYAALGSGAAAFKRIFSTEGKDVFCPVRSAYGTFAMEPTCGGALEVWRLPQSRNDRLTKLEVLPNRSLIECFKQASQPNKFTYYEVSRQWLTELIRRSARSLRRDSKVRTTLPPPKQPDLLMSRFAPRKQAPSSPASTLSTNSPALPA